MLRITCLVFVLAVVAMVSCNREALTQAVIQESGNSNLEEGSSGLYLDANGFAEACDTSVADDMGGTAYSEAGDNADDAVGFASKLAGDRASSASSVACDAFACPDGNVYGACAFE
ncbi:uncharacterized protein LOC124275460 [Haliotis rubra]|uniref:uncharacterized protein LOC124275460 n=1 Tax=Haliotis rubra TaxID=36100 RepID=UPI001EE5ACCB|nr:uncharacterized protein LOC124275460 [Haliotis rubra]